ncbi:MAG: BON domain-containing protein [Gammaproteobacteria bacterium]
MSKMNLISLSVLCLFIQACAAPLVVGGAATGAVVANDKRTTGTFVEDEAIELKIRSALLGDDSFKNQIHINATSFNTNVLLTGEATTEAIRQQIVAIAKNTEKVSHVFNEIRVAAPSALLARSSDTLLTSNVKTRILTDKTVDGTKIKVVTEAGVVYLMGIITREQGTNAAQVASKASGVQRVVKIFQYLD